MLHEQEIECALTTLLQVLFDAGGKGLLVRYLQADRVVALFATAAARLDGALANLEDATSGQAEGQCSGVYTDNCEESAAFTPARRLPEEVRTELRILRRLLQVTEFRLPAGHFSNLDRFRKACDGLHMHFQSMMLSYNDMMEHMKLDPLLDKKSFRAVIDELKSEVELQQQVLQAGYHVPACGQAPCGERRPAGRSVHAYHNCRTEWEIEQARRFAAAEQHYVRMLMDVVRASHVDTDREAPLEFLCPLTHQMMQDPVLLHDTGHSYERKALEEWWASGHHFCPRTGLHLRRLNISPNYNLRSAIERWALHSDMHLSFKPVLDTLVLQGQQQQRQQQQQQDEQALRSPQQTASPFLQRPELPQALVPTPEEYAEAGSRAGQLEVAPSNVSLDLDPASCSVTGSCSNDVAARLEPMPQQLLQGYSNGSVERSLAAVIVCPKAGGDVPAIRAGDLLVGIGGDVCRAGNGPVSEATGHCNPSLECSQRSSSQELELNRIDSCSWSGDATAASEVAVLACVRCYGTAGKICSPSTCRAAERDSEGGITADGEQKLATGTDSPSSMDGQPGLKAVVGHPGAPNSNPAARISRAMSNKF